ncbi:hypothetical protein Tco_0597578 [Tanacetum coccineum]
MIFELIVALKKFHSGEVCGYVRHVESIEMTSSSLHVEIGTNKAIKAPGRRSLKGGNPLRIGLRSLVFWVLCAQRENTELRKGVHGLDGRIWGARRRSVADCYNRLYAKCDEFCQEEAPKTSHLEAVKHILRYIKGTTHLGLWYPKGTGIEIVVYADSDHAGDYVDRKSTSGICTFMGCCLTSWFSKKQTALAISTTEAEYVSAGKACQQALWMKQALIDYDVRLDDVPIMCDNKGAIDLSKNPVQHSRTKHIKIRHHFLRDNV